jgi:magnesium-transporting ATPase (P-type)
VITHAERLETVERRLGTDARRGITSAEAADRLARFGPNAPGRPERPAYARILLRQLADPIVALLIVATIVAAALGERVEAAAIALIVLLNAVLGFTQEAGAERAVLGLRDRLRRTAAVVRDGREIEIPAEEVVPGDLLLVREGDRIAADARVAEAVGFEVDESMLTGESVPVGKTAEPVSEQAALGDRASVLFAGTAVTRGHGRAVVVATGDSTEAGRITRLVATARPPKTPLQERLGTTARILAAGGVLLTVGLTTAMTLRGEPLREAFFVGVSVAVAAVPEGLGHRDDLPCARRTRDGGTRRDRQPARGSRDARRDDRRLYRQDRHADPERSPRSARRACGRVHGLGRACGRRARVVG